MAFRDCVAPETFAVPETLTFLRSHLERTHIHVWTVAKGCLARATVQNKQYTDSDRDAGHIKKHVNIGIVGMRSGSIFNLEQPPRPPRRLRRR